ncbi:MAG: UvrD-helicase domain-containing protein, partial [Deltaproteobacteria bacterium]|nr:UvrD-helicase domain-containing protein [Deltaproteobacteria bacterium]
MSNNISLNKNQQIAAEYKDQHILVLAGAGTGKTLTIIARAEYLIRKGVD